MNLLYMQCVYQMCLCCYATLFNFQVHHWIYIFEGNTGNQGVAALHLAIISLKSILIKRNIFRILLTFSVIF